MPVDTALLRASVTYNESTVPASLAVGRMLRGPLVPLGAAAFTARSEQEALLATFATWNMLDAIMFERSRLIRDRKNGSMSINVGRAHSWQTGYVREVQVRRMVLDGAAGARGERSPLLRGGHERRAFGRSHASRQSGGPRACLRHHEAQV